MIFFAAIVGAVLGLKRRCPRCGRDQLVSKDKRNATVKCKFCNAEIPAKRQMK